MNRPAALALFLLVLASGCSKSFDQVIEERGAEARASLQQVEKVGTGSLTFHEVLKDIVLPDGEKLRFDESPNAALVQAESFDAENQQPKLDLILDKAWLDQSRNAFSNSPAEIDGSYLEVLLDKLIALKYLVIVRTRLMAEPSAAGGGLFSPGLWQGEVMVFGIESGEFLGGAPLTVSNSEEVNVNADDPEEWLRSNLWENVRVAVKEALAPYSQDSPLD